MSDGPPRGGRFARPLSLMAFVLAVLAAGWALNLLFRPLLAPRPEAAKEAIRRLLDEQAAAWNKGDLEGFMTGYWQSADLSFSSGKDNRRGWQAVLDRYRKNYQADGNEMGQLTFSDLEIDPLGPDSAFVRGRWQVVTSEKTLGGLFTLIVKRLPEGWRIVHDHTSG